MNSKKFKKYQYLEGSSLYIIEEDLVGWYLIVYKNSDTAESSKDYLFDTFEDALFEAKERFGIRKLDWKECAIEEDEQ